MAKSISIALFLFSSCICFSQNSEIQVKDITSTTSTSKSGLEATPKAQLKEEIIGRPAFVDLGTPILEPNSPSKGNGNDNSDQKKSINGKNVTKPQ